MSFAAIYKNGVFQPLGKVDLPDGTRVEVEVVPISDAIPIVGNGSPLRDSNGKLLSLGLTTAIAEDFKAIGEEWGEYKP